MKKKNVLIIFCFTIILLLFSIYFAKYKCEEARYAFDFGSGTLKAHSAIVNKCDHKIVAIIKESIGKHTKFEQCYEGGGNTYGEKVISQVCIDNALISFNEIEKELGISCLTSKCAGIATAWARKAANASEIIEIFRNLGVNLKALSQDDEGITAFKTVMISDLLKDQDPNNVIVFDIGGGSFQFTTIHNGEFHVYHGDYGIFNFEDKVRKHYRILASDESPYLHGKILDDTLEMATNEIGKKILDDPVFREKLKNSNTKIFAMGSPLSKGFKNEMNLPINLSKQDVFEAAHKFEMKTSDDIKASVYPKLLKKLIHSAQKPCILVYGIMNGASIEKMQILDLMTMDYLLVNNENY